MARITLNCPRCESQIILDIKTIDDLRRENLELKQTIALLKAKHDYSDDNMAKMFESLFMTGAKK